MACLRPLVLLVLAAVPALATPAEASEPLPPRGTVWTVMTHVQVSVCENYAIVHVIADIRNRGPDPEFPFRVDVPDDAMVTGLSIERDGVTFAARVEDRDRARSEYDGVKRREDTGGIVEKARGSSSYAFLVNVAEFTSVRATLTYERYLAAAEDEFVLDVLAPVSGFGRDLGAAFDVTVCHSDGVASARSEPAGAIEPAGDGYRVTWATGPRSSDAATPFRVAYTLDPARDGGSIVAARRGGEGVFVHRFRAPPDAVTLPIDLVLVLDVSGSMSGLKLTQMQDAAAQLVAALDVGDRIHVVTFSSTATSAWPGLEPATPARRVTAAAVVREAIAAGGTNVGSGIAEGFEAYRHAAREAGAAGAAGERLPLLVFLTDGQATNGETDRSRLRTMARDANGFGATVFAIAFGEDADWPFVAGLAADGNGRAIRVEEGRGAEVDLTRFLTALTTPVLRDVAISYAAEGAVAYRAASPILFAGSELLVVGKFPSGLATLAGTVRAIAPDGPREYEFNVEPADAAAEFLPRLVAFHEIRDLDRRIAADGERAEWTSRVRDLALAYGFVTDYTSLVLALPDDDRRRGPVRMDEEDASASCAACGAPASSRASATPAPGPTPASAPFSWGSSAREADVHSEGPTIAARSLVDLSDDAIASPPTPATIPREPAAVPPPAIALLLAAVALAALGRRWASG